MKKNEKRRADDIINRRYTHTSKTNVYDEIELLRRLLRSSSSSFREKKKKEKNSILSIIMEGAVRVEKL